MDYDQKVQFFRCAKACKPILYVYNKKIRLNWAKAHQNEWLKQSDESFHFDETLRLVGSEFD